jgi:hypothetical protein
VRFYFLNFLYMNNIKKNRTRGKSYFNKDLQGTNIYKNIEPRNGVAKADGTGCCNNPNVGCGVCKGCTYTITPANPATEDEWNSLSMYVAVNPTQKSNLEAPCNWDYTAKIISPQPGSATGSVATFTISIESNKCIDKTTIKGIYIYPCVAGGQGKYIGKYTNCDSGVTGTRLTATSNSITTKGTRTGAPYRNPIAGWRKAKCDNPRKIPTNTIYADRYTDCSSCEVNKGIQGRTFRPIIRSGMQEKNDCCKKANGECGKKNDYSFSYRQYQNNKRCLSFEKSLEKIGSCKDANGKCTYEYDKSSCCPTCAVGKPCKKTIYKPNNKKFSKQGAVSSGSRLDRLKLDTIRSARSGGTTKKKADICTDNKKKAECKDGIPKGKYFAGKPRFTGYAQRRPIGLGWSVAAKRNVRNARK